MKDRGISPTAAARGGSALIVTLFFVSLITILLLGFLEGMKEDVLSAHYHYGGILADVYADAGRDAALTQLRAATAVTNGMAPAGTNDYVWLSLPGRIYAPIPGGTLYTNYELCSGAETRSGPPANEAADLNPATLANPAVHLIAATNGSLYVKWIYLHQDGSLDTNAPPAAAPAPGNPYVGRFAYWVDDESAKINLNTAWDRTGNTNGPGHPSQINLNALSAADDLAIRAYRDGAGQFNSVQESGRATNITAVVSNNLFSLTTYNHSPGVSLSLPGLTNGPNLNLFGKPRIVLTTQLMHAYAAGNSNCFLNILKNPGTIGALGDDPGMLANLNQASLNTAFQMVIAALSQTNYPFLGPAGKTLSFQQKYGAAITAEVALNIIDYVRSAESTNQCIEPIRATVTASGSSYSLSTLGSGTWIANTGRRLYMSEYGAWLGPFSTGHTPVETLTAVYVPPVIPGGNNSDIAINMTNYFLYDSLESPPSGASLTNTVMPGSVGDGIRAPGNGPILNGGEYATLVHAWTSNVTNVPTASISLLGTYAVPPYTAAFNNKLQTAGGVSITYPILQVFSMPLNSGGLDTDVQSYHLDDPAGYSWTVGRSTFAKPWTHATSLGGASTAVPQQDADGSGGIANGSYVPAPKGTPSNPDGMVHSVGELGFVHTGGAPGLSPPTINWRTIRLQPQNRAGVFPDWAILDLFAAPPQNYTPSAAEAPFLIPFTNSPIGLAGGRMNINNMQSQLIDSKTAQPLVRLLPLAALVQDATNYADALTHSTVDSGAALTLASNITAGVMARKNGNVGTPYGTNIVSAGTNLYFTPGQLAEVAGVADGGEGSEALLRNIVGVATTRGDVFTIYTVGQALQQDGNGNIHVLGERRCQVMVERIMTDAGSPAFRPVYSKELQP